MIVDSRSFTPPCSDPLSGAIPPEPNGRGNKIFIDIREALSTTIQTSPPHAHEREVRVIVHKVKPEDTFAGIVLFYDVPMGRLKKLNRLWSTDSIHLRKFLYIPLELIQYQRIYCKLREIQTPELIDDASSISTNSTWGTSSPRSPLVPMATVPYSELQFFTKKPDDHASTPAEPSDDPPSLVDAFGITYLGRVADTLLQASHKAMAGPKKGGLTENYELQRLIHPL
ncbi:hypothetical protein K493DRAFT_357229 [Basidiobolus meristosporus CBS 931.73]|uniref:LysM domain-containing protein n=1 Tax=Basidiobolus meristosporus CBS 931.73 TaxID=1314790 RepID=A0A1Y1XXP8_9FUNG|nr:hypothetical protein K493DRAFT_357229 [Basidiobolus meristosporus CBS 931.73]|eukprot:ORX90134.1 hypothetical protein K493DRAFT_357229 [Basidiobolus meristosporus CBS 931.73]